MTTIRERVTRHKEKINDLQEKCDHSQTRWARNDRIDLTELAEDRIYDATHNLKLTLVCKECDKQWTEKIPTLCPICEKAPLAKRQRTDIEITQWCFGQYNAQALFSYICPNCQRVFLVWKNPST